MCGCVVVRKLAKDLTSDVVGSARDTLNVQALCQELRQCAYVLWYCDTYCDTHTHVTTTHALGSDHFIGMVFTGVSVGQVYLPLLL